MASNVPKLGGYDLNFVDDPPDDLICLICTLVAKDPQQVTCCGKIFCSQCLTEHKKYSNACVQCRKISSSSFADQRSERHIKQLKVNCTNITSGCNWTGELRSYDEHCSKCRYMCVECICGKRILEVDLAEHESHFCPSRTVECAHCGKVGKHHEILGDHQLSCPKYKVACPNVGCNELVARIQMPKHRLSCQYETINCKHENIGCTTTMLRKDRATHETNYELHLSHAMDTISRMKVQMKSVESSSLEHTVFKMPNYVTYQKARKFFYGPPFYSHPGGYKMCIRVSMNGSVNDVEKSFDSCVSIHVFFMPGHNDDNLQWPFRGEVKLELLNQDEDRDHHVQSITYGDNKDDGDNRRVVGRQRSPSGLGKTRYISFLKLANNPQYTKEDTLYFRVTVTPRRAPKPWLTCTA